MKPSNPSSSTFSSRLPALLEKCSHWDKDERYMATNDLRLELLKGAAAAPLDEAMEAKVCACVIKQLEDASNDVQAVAVQTLGVLFRRVRVGQVERFADKLCDLIIQGKTSLRDIYAICLRNLLTDVPEEVGAAVAERIALRLLGGISGTVAAAVASASGGSRDNDTELKRECIDTLSELLLRFGPSVSEQHPRLVDALVARLDDEAHILRKRAAVSIGALATSLSDDLLAKLVHAVVSRADRPGDVSRSSTSVHALGMITRSVGRRLRTVMRDVMPVFLRFSEGPDALAEELQEGLGDSEGGAISRCDMVEFCLGGLEAAVRQCPRETRPYLAQIVDRGCAYLTFDPNYNYAVEDVELDRGQDDYGGDYGYDDAGGDQDFYNPTEDDDASWKLRRAAARVLSAVALRGVQALGGSDPRGASSSASSRAGIVGRIGDALTSRIVERVEAVKIDVLETIEAMMLASPPEANYGSGNT
jgi:cullin-associated NEDD8-dissociated protein 1